MNLESVEDDEWVSWDDIIRQIHSGEWSQKHPNADLSLVPYFETLILTAEQYRKKTGKHLQIYGAVGELYGSITIGMTLHKSFAQGSDGRQGNDFIEVKTITPLKKNDYVLVKAGGNFNKLLIVKINKSFEMKSRLIDRSELPKPTNKRNLIKVPWPE